MADTYTTNLNLTKPEPGAAEDTWGISLNADLDALDAIFGSGGTAVSMGAVTMDGLTVDGNTSSQTYRSSRTDGDVYIQATTDTDFVKIGTQTKINALLVDGSGDISFYDDTGSTQGLFWDASAETLAIGHTNPSSTYRLDVAGSIRSTGTAPSYTLQESDAGNQTWLMASYGGTFAVRDTTVSGSAYPLQIQAATPSNTLYLKSDGNVGIGTDSPSDKLTVNGTINHTNSSDVYKIFSTGSGLIYAGSTSSSSVAFITGGGEKARLDTSGNLGINTTAPSEKLHVEGRIRLGTTPAIVSHDNITIDIDQNNNSGSNYFRVTHDGESSELFRVGENGNVGIGTNNPSATLDVTNASGQAGIDVDSFTNNNSYISFKENGTSRFSINHDTSSNALTFYNSYGSSEAARIDSSGKIGIGTSSPVTPLHVSTAKSSVTDSVLTLQDTTETFGKMIEFVGQGSTDCRGIIGFQEPEDNAPELYIANGGVETSGNGVGLAFWSYITVNRIIPCDNLGALRDDAIDLGSSNARFDDIYATNGTIQTSDRNDKQDIQALSDAETRVATACKGLLRKFRWQNAVTEKGDEARYHFGIISQDLQDAFTAEGLDAGDYGMFISQTWEDSNGVEQTRLGVRYSELLAFIIAAI